MGRYAKKSVALAPVAQALELVRKSRRKDGDRAPNRRELSQVETTMILKSVRHAGSITDVSRATGLRRATVRKVLKQHGVKMPDGRRGLSDELKAVVRNLTVDVVPRKELEEMFGAS